MEISKSEFWSQLCDFEQTIVSSGEEDAGPAAAGEIDLLFIECQVSSHSELHSRTPTSECPLFYQSSARGLRLFSRTHDLANCCERHISPSPDRCFSFHLSPSLSMETILSPELYLGDLDKLYLSLLRVCKINGEL